MEQSILLTIKKMLGGAALDTNFDIDIIVHINSAMSDLNLLGIGPPEGFSISGPDENWTALIGTDPKLDMVKTFVYAKVKLIFDPPPTAAVIDAFNRIISEIEWKLTVL